MKQLALMILVVAGAMLVAQSFDTSKAADPVKTMDEVIAVRVPIRYDGRLHPAIPRALRELRKMDIVLYDSENMRDARFAIVVMVIPEENVVEFNKRLSLYPSVEKLTEQEVRDNKAVYLQCELALDHLKDRVEFALTPYEAVGAFK